MPARTRFFAALSFAACVAGMPVTFSLHGVAAPAALAKGGNRGNGNGNSQGGNNGNSQGGNNGGGNSQGNRSGASQGNANGNRKSANASTTTETDPVSGDKITVSPGAIELIHSNGFSERIADGHYQMRDGQGRLVIDRSATERDRLRLLTTVR